MINIFKKLILTLSLIVVVTMGLSKWGPQVTLQAGQITISGTDTQVINSDNLFKFSDNGTYTKDGVTITYNSEYQTITLNGTASQNTEFILQLEQLAPAHYYFKMYPVSGTVDALTKTILAPGNPSFDAAYNYFSGFINSTLSNISNESVVNQLKIAPKLGVVYSNYVFKFSIKKDSAVTEWVHPNQSYYKSSISLSSNFSGTIDDIKSQYNASSDVFGDISSDFEIVNSASKYSAILAVKYGYTPDSIVNQYNQNSLNINITSQLILNKALVDQLYESYAQTSIEQYLESELIVGNTYKLILSVKDNNLDYKYIEISILIIDGSGPEFMDDTTIITGYTEFIDISEWLDLLNINDYSTVVSRVVIQDDYTENKETIGNYSVIVKATDSLGNFTDETFTFTVIDNVIPEINGPSTFMKPITSTLTVNDIKKLYTAHDYISGNVTSRIEVFSDDYSGMGHIENTYEIVLKVTDISGNETFKPITINVTSDIPSVNYVADGITVNLNSDYVLTIEDIKDILVSSGNLILYSDTNYNVLLNEYIGNEQTPGSYSISIRFSQTSGITETHSITAVVNDILSNPDGSFNASSGGNILVYLGIGLSVIVVIVIFKKKH